jgi:predicted nucleic acid-binding protein
MTLLVLDAGAFIAHDRGDARIREILDAVLRRGGKVVSPSPVIAQVWRNGSRQARLARLLRSVDVLSPGLDEAKSAGLLCAKSETSDVVDALVALCALDGSVVLTSDVEDLEHLAKTLNREVLVQHV